jgi:transposase
MNQLLVGIDWSQKHYDGCIIAPSGATLTEFRIARTTAGLQQLQKKIAAFDVPAGDCLVGIETAHDILLDFLWSCHYQVYVIAPSVVNGSRGRFGSSGAHTDRADARLIADVLRTDRPRFAPWRPDSPLLMKIKVRLGQIDDLTKTIIQHNNRLKAILLRVYPQPMQTFCKLSMPLTLHFLIAYPTPAALESLTRKEFAAFCREHKCNRPQWIRKWYEALKQPLPQAELAITKAYEAEIVFLARLILMLLREKQRGIKAAQRLSMQHPDHTVFASLPGAGTLLQPKLLVMFGEDRDRFPAPQSIRQLAGTCPVTKQSGKKRQVVFRNACNHAHRNTMQQFAVASIRYADWAFAYYQAARRRGHSKNSALRRLANRWLGIIWKLWQRQECYDEAYHLKQIHRQRRPVQ